MSKSKTQIPTLLLTSGIREDALQGEKTAQALRAAWADFNIWPSRANFDRVQRLTQRVSQAHIKIAKAIEAEAYAQNRDLTTEHATETQA